MQALQDTAMLIVLPIGLLYLQFDRGLSATEFFEFIGLLKIRTFPILPLTLVEDSSYNFS
jgi:hypothetical protein